MSPIAALPMRTCTKWHSQGESQALRDAYAASMARHRALVRDHFAAHRRVTAPPRTTITITIGDAAPRWLVDVLRMTCLKILRPVTCF